MGSSAANGRSCTRIWAPAAAKSWTVGRFRFIKCSTFLDERRLSVIEHATLPSVPYAAVSYPWDGLKCNNTSKGFFRVRLEGQTSAPISLAVLHTACLAARRFGVDLLWIDQMCIMQTSKRDKEWQIAQMFDLYDRSEVCLVLAGGLQRLAAHDESTPWIQRSWTLQEAMPTTTYGIFGWKSAGGRLGGLTHGEVYVIEKGRSAMMELGEMLQAAHVGNGKFSIFGPDQNPILALMAVKDATDPAMRDMGVWRSALLRTCSQPRDMILSIMGIFGVKLDVRKYGKDDRDEATLDLAFEILKSGRPASWLGAIPGCENLARMCTMPSPRPVDDHETFCNAAGHNCGDDPWKTRNLGSGLTWYIKPTAEASMLTRGCGCLHLTTKTLRVILGDSQGRCDFCTFWPSFKYLTTLTLNEGVETGTSASISLSTPLASGKYQAVVIGLVKHFDLPATTARAVLGAALLMLMTWNCSIDRWENVGYGTVRNVDELTESWPTCVHLIGC